MLHHYDVSFDQRVSIHRYVPDFWRGSQGLLYNARFDDQTSILHILQQDFWQKYSTMDP